MMDVLLDFGVLPNHSPTNLYSTCSHLSHLLIRSTETLLSKAINKLVWLTKNIIIAF